MLNCAANTSQVYSSCIPTFEYVPAIPLVFHLPCSTLCLGTDTVRTPAFLKEMGSLVVQRENIAGSGVCIYVTEHPSMHHPLETHYQPQLSHQGSTMVTYYVHPITSPSQVPRQPRNASVYYVSK